MRSSHASDVGGRVARQTYERVIPYNIGAQTQAASFRGAPQGNGMWRHGLRSAEVIERRRAMTAAMRMIRQALA